MLIQICEWTIDTQKREVRIGAERCNVPHRNAELLFYLCDRAGQTISKHELLDRVWGTQVVEESALHYAISSLRQFFDDKDHRFITTVHRKGYKIVLPEQDREHISQIATAVTSASDANPGTLLSDSSPPDFVSPIRATKLTSRWIEVLLTSIMVVGIIAAVMASRHRPPMLSQSFEIHSEQSASQISGYLHQMLGSALLAFDPIALRGARGSDALSLQIANETGFRATLAHGEARATVELYQTSSRAALMAAVGKLLAIKPRQISAPLFAVTESTTSPSDANSDIAILDQAFRNERGTQAMAGRLAFALNEAGDRDLAALVANDVLIQSQRNAQPFSTSATAVLEPADCLAQFVAADQLVGSALSNSLTTRNGQLCPLALARHLESKGEIKRALEQLAMLQVRHNESPATLPILLKSLELRGRLIALSADAKGFIQSVDATIELTKTLNWPAGEGRAWELKASWQRQNVQGEAALVSFQQSSEAFRRARDFRSLDRIALQVALMRNDSSQVDLSDAEKASSQTGDAYLRALAKMVLMKHRPWTLESPLSITKLRDEIDLLPHSAAKAGLLGSLYGVSLRSDNPELSKTVAESMLRAANGFPTLQARALNRSAGADLERGEIYLALHAFLALDKSYAQDSTTPATYTCSAALAAIEANDVPNALRWSQQCSALQLDRSLRCIVQLGEVARLNVLALEKKPIAIAAVNALQGSSVLDFNDFNCARVGLFQAKLFIHTKEKSAATSALRRLANSRVKEFFATELQAAELEYCFAFQQKHCKLSKELPEKLGQKMLFLTWRVTQQCRSDDLVVAEALAAQGDKQGLVVKARRLSCAAANCSGSTQQACQSHSL